MKLCLYADLCPTLLTSLDDSNTAKTTDANSHLNPNILPIIRVLQLFSLSQFHLCVTNSFLLVYLGVIDFSYFDVLSEPIIAVQLVQPNWIFSSLTSFCALPPQWKFFGTQH
jgi:hypothetical protein